MKKLRITVTILFFFNIFFVYQAFSGTKHNIEYRITFPKNIFIEGEDMILNMTFKNIGSKVDSLIKISGADLLKNLIFSDEKGDNSTYQGAVNSKDTTIVLKPNQDYTLSENIRWTRGYEHVGLFSYIPEGNYRVKGVFKNGKTNIGSNEILFRVIAPTGTEKEVFDGFIRINKLEMNKDSKTENIINDLTLLFKKYPESIYSDQIFLKNIIIRNITGIKHDSTFIEDCLWYIQKKPDSKILDLALDLSARVIQQKYGGNEKVREFLTALKEKYPNSRIFIESNKILQSKKYK